MLKDADAPRAYAQNDETKKDKKKDRSELQREKKNLLSESLTLSCLVKLYLGDYMMCTDRTEVWESSPINLSSPSSLMGCIHTPDPHTHAAGQY